MFNIFSFTTKTPDRKHNNMRRMMQWLWYLPFTVVIGLVMELTLTFAQGTQGLTDVGFVLDIYGKWQLQGVPLKRLNMGDSLPAEGVIRALSPENRDHYITILLMDGRTQTHACNSPSGCSQPVQLPKTWHKQPKSFSIVEAVKRLFSDQPCRYISIISRSNVLQNGVVELQAGKLDLRPVFQGMRQGFYLVLFEAYAEDDQEGGELPEPVKYEWNPERPLPLVAGNLKPGLYNVELLNPYTDVQEPLGINSWVIVTPPGEYAKTQKAFYEAVKLSQKWGKAVRPEAARAFLQAYLASLAGHEK